MVYYLCCECWTEFVSVNDCTLLTICAEFASDHFNTISDSNRCIDKEGAGKSESLTLPLRLQFCAEPGLTAILWPDEMFKVAPSKKVPCFAPFEPFPLKIRAAERAAERVFARLRLSSLRFMKG